MQDWFTRKAAKFAIKEALALGFVLSCGLAKMFPITEGADFRQDAIIYMLMGGLLYFAWDYAR